MRHLKNFFLKISVHPITLIYFIFAWFGGYLKWYLSTLLIVCLHELCHLLMAYYFNFKIDKIEILPFGAYLSLKDFYFHPILHEICVVLAGPCSHLFIYAFIQTMSSGVYHDYLLEMNLWVFFFNLIPIYPMDGSRVVGLLLQRFMDLKNALYLNLKLSVFAFCVFFVCFCQINTIIILGYLLIQQIEYMKFIPIYLRKYYTQIPTFDDSRKVIINECLIYRRGYHNYYYINNHLTDEKEIVFDLLKSVKK